MGLLRMEPQLREQAFRRPSERRVRLVAVGQARRMDAEENRPSQTVSAPISTSAHPHPARDRRRRERRVRRMRGPCRDMAGGESEV